MKKIATFLTILTMSLGFGVAAAPIASADAYGCLAYTLWWSSGLAKGVQSTCAGVTDLQSQYPLNEQRPRILCRKNSNPTISVYKTGPWVYATAPSVATCDSNYIMTYHTVQKR